ncbi:hypothetical protein WDU94_004306 [Cyamophila willieti]
MKDLKDTIPSTVIKLPLDSTSNVGKKIRLRNNIRLTLPPDRFSLLQNGSLCFLCILYLTYTLYLHYLISCHVTQQIETNRFFSEEIEKLSQAIVRLDQRQLQQAVAESNNALAGSKYVDDLKLSLRAFVDSLQTLKSNEEAVANSSEEYEDDTTENDDSSYDERLIEDTQLVNDVGLRLRSQNLLNDVKLVLKPQRESEGGQEQISNAEKKDLENTARRFLQSYGNVIPINAIDQVDRLPSNSKDMSKNCTKCSKGYLFAEENVALKSIQSSNRAILPNLPSEEVMLVLPLGLPDGRSNELPDLRRSKELPNELPRKSRRVRSVPSPTVIEQRKGKKKRKHKNSASASTRENFPRKNEGALEKQTRAGGRKFVSVLLKGATPTASIRDGGSVIRPWYMDTRANGNSNVDVNGHFILQELNGKIQVMKTGLYMVYAQIYYTSPDHFSNISDSVNSYSITISSPTASDRAIAVCSVHSGVNYTSEVSCHLSIVYHLSVGDKLFLVQREPNRKILLKDGYSYFGISTLRVES